MNYVVINLDSIVEDLQAQLEAMGFECVWDGDRGGEYIQGECEDYNGSPTFTLHVDVDCEIECEEEVFFEEDEDED